MRIFEITSPEEQLGLLRLIIDNTWSAIASQADQHRQSAAPRQTPSTPTTAAKHKRKAKVATPTKLPKKQTVPALSPLAKQPGAMLKTFPLSNPQYYQQFLKPGFKSMQVAR